MDGRFILEMTPIGRRLTYTIGLELLLGALVTAMLMALRQATNNMEWYDPEAITTENGSLVITLSQKETHDMHYQGGKS